ncbi:fibronectin type III-like domain-contianing protein [Colwellia sp. MSW7]|uniref:Fibronectin type III-like domain-contianing protein n=1 Tax=Colwellia maritima TaxID=2912588 RepID=A0ABS9WZ09_9GAMM|nr:fibronectin type III-like domain-contianing protein [Colwellia maritima]
MVQLYLRDVESSVSRPIKELKGFAKVMLQPKETKIVRFKLTTRDLSFWDEKTNDWLAEPGEFEVLLGNSLDNISHREKFILQ